jgi:hypothetical protein
MDEAPAAAEPPPAEAEAEGGKTSRWRRKG